MSAHLPVGTDPLSGREALLWPDIGVSMVDLPLPSSASHPQENARPSALRRRKIKYRKPYPCTFASCEKSYKTSLNLQKHQKHHPRSFGCRYIPCSSVFLSVRDRTDHEVLLHGKSKQLTCYLCKNYTSENESYVRAHVLRMHEEILIDDAMARIVDGIDPPSKAEAIERQEFQRPGFETSPPKISNDYVCYMCPFSSKKRINMYQHVWRKHRDGALDMKAVMAKITKAKNADPGGEEL